MYDISLFVYGTLLSEASRPAAEMLNRELEPRKACVAGSIYDLGWYPGYSTEGSEDDLVHGEIIQISGEELDLFDMYEGYPHLYTRQVVQARTDDGPLEDVIIYVYNGSFEDEHKIPKGDWLKYLEVKDTQADILSAEATYGEML